MEIVNNPKSFRLRRRNEATVLRKLSVCVLFGGISPEHEVSLRSAESVLNNMDPEKYNIFPVGITKEGNWVLYNSTDYSKLPTGEWLENPDNRRAAISPVRGQGLLSFEGDCVVRERIDVVFPVLHGENGEDGAMQGLLQMAGIPYVGPHVSASAVAMDKTLTKLVVDQAKVVQATWQLVRNRDLDNHMDTILDRLEEKFAYPMFVKPAGTGSSVGVSKAADREALRRALLAAGTYDDKILVEEFIHGREVEVAVMGNDSPVASVCGEIDSGAEFYDYDAKYVTDTSVAYIPARISEDVAEQVRDAAVKVYRAIGCQGLSRVDFFVTYEEERVVFNEINTLPGFTSISMFPKLFNASGIPYPELIDQLLQLALEAAE
jgi:D-alanine-D-alanine ligase